MNFIKLTTKEQFESIRRGDTIIVKWSEYFTNHTQDCKEIMMYTVYQNKKDCNEIICRKKNNHFFNYELFLQEKSQALEIYKIEK